MTERTYLFNPTDKSYQAPSMSWAQRLKRVFNIDITECEACAKHNVIIIGCITDSTVINKIIDHFYKIASPITTSQMP